MLNWLFASWASVHRWWVARSGLAEKVETGPSEVRVEREGRGQDQARCGTPKVAKNCLSSAAYPGLMAGQRGHLLQPGVSPEKTGARRRASRGQHHTAPAPRPSARSPHGPAP